MFSIHANVPLPERMTLVGSWTLESWLEDNRQAANAHLGDMPLGPITLLLGANGAGKSSVIRFLALVLTGDDEQLAGHDPTASILAWRGAIRGPDDVDTLREVAEHEEPGSMHQPNWIDDGRFITDLTRVPAGTPTHGRNMLLHGEDFHYDPGPGQHPWSGLTVGLPFAHRVLAFGPSLGALDDLSARAVELGGTIAAPTYRTYGAHGMGLGDDGQPSPEVFERARIINERMNSILPGFLERLGYFSVVPLPAVEALKSGRRARLVLDRPDGTTVEGNHLSSAQRRWLEICLSVAAAGLHCPCENWEEGGQTFGLADNPKQLLVLIDEPELHLHPIAQADIVDWVDRLARVGVRFVLATHSARLLTTDASLSTFVRVDRDAEVPIRAIEADAMAVIDDFGDALGMGRDALYAALGGVVLVEGLDDQRVLEHFYRDELQRHRLLVLPIDGHKNTNNVATAELIARLGIPLHLMLDKLDGGASDEQRAADRFIASLRDQGRAATTVAFDGPDIVTGISLQTIVQIWPQHERVLRSLSPELKWDDITSKYEATGPHARNFKSWFVERLARNPQKATLAMRELIDALVRLPDAVPSPQLDSAMESLFGARTSELRL